MEGLIRNARRGDADMLVQLWLEMMDQHALWDARFRFGEGASREFQRRITGMIRSPRACVLVAEVQGRVVGFATGELTSRPETYPDGSYGFISELFVREEYRNRGIGTALVQQVLEWMRKRGVTVVELLAAERNADGRAFWEHLGFEAFLRLMRVDLAPGVRPDV